MDIYESILDFKQPSSSTNTTSSAVVEQSKSSATQKTPTKFTKTCEYEISSPESNDSGIHSEDRLNRLSNGATAQNSVKTSAESSLYSSVISSKKSSDRLSREASTYSRLDEFGELLHMQQQQQQKQLQQEEIQVYRNQIDVKQLEEDQHVVEYEEINSGDNFLHLEQHELPLGWVRCCDEEGIYYWHKPSGTVTRHPPTIPVKPTATTASTTRTTNSISNSNISSSTSSSKGTTPSPSPLSSSECSSSSSSSSSSAPTTTVLNAVQHPAPTSKSPPAKNFNVNNEYESILETTTLAMATSTDDDDNDEAKTFTFSEYVRPKSKTTTTTTAATNQTATSASEDRSMIGGGGPDSTSLSTFSNLSSSALSNSFDQPAKAQPALLPLPLSHFSRPSNPSTDTDLDQDNFQDNEDKKPSMYGSRKDRPTKHINIQTRYGSDFTSVSPLSTSSSNSTSSSSSNCLSALDNTKSSRHNNRSQLKQDDKSHHQVESVVLTRRDGEASVANSSKPSLPIRFYVRSLGWVTISEADLTPERSSRAVNKCINDLSRGTKDLNDVVARWGDGKDLYMDLDDSNLVLIDPIDDNVLNTQPITSIRVWGVGRDNASRDFAYVARDKQTKIHMCHVFRCDSAPAKEIANTLKETCRRVIAAEKSRSSFGGVATTVVDSAAPTTTTTTATNSQTSLNNRLANMMLKRPSYLPDIAVNTSKVDINLKLRSVSFNSREEVEERLSAMAMATSTTASIIEENNVGGTMLTPMDEPCKRHPCKYLGSLPVNKPYGMDVLNEAVDKIYNRALDEYRKMRREKRMKSRRGRRKKAGLYRHDSGKNDKQGYDDDDMDDDMDDYDYDEDEDDDEDDECDEMNTVSFDSMFELNSERKLGCDVDVCVSPSTITVRRRASNSHDIVDDDEVLFETRIRFLSFMGISNDVRLCGFIVHCVDNSFRCYAFMCENSCGPLCKTIEAACKLRYQKCIDAHPEAAGVVSNRNGAQNESRLNSRFGNFGIQISKTVFDSITKTRNIFSNLNLANISNNNNNNTSTNGKSTKM